jgi:hypothetical protein
MPDTGHHLSGFQVGSLPLFLIGSFDNGVTVWNQQVRALNLAHALVEQEFLLCKTDHKAPLDQVVMKEIAIVGGGFAGLTLAAGLIKKRVNARITIFEQRDTLLPLQQGSDSRWLHPHIYDWPRDGSEAGVAMLPVLNWTSARASDVVVQVLNNWKKIAVEHEPLSVYCNARHLQIDRREPKSERLKIEWVAERRAIDGMGDGTNNGAIGASANYDAVILAVGFGLEKSSESSYWRNETLGQPSLDQPRRTFMVAGQGDGAMIDLLRLRISQYRQDRILEELFLKHRALTLAIKDIYNNFGPDSGQGGLFEQFERLSEASHPCAEEFELLMGDLRRRLRRDTDAILRLQVRRFSELFGPDSRISFQNRLLVYLLYKCGGFFPSSAKEGKLRVDHGIPENQHIRRYGADSANQLHEVLSDELFAQIVKTPGSKPTEFNQPSKILWLGGYFGYPGPRKGMASLSDEVKGEWRKEYLPGPTGLLCSALSASFAGLLRQSHADIGKLRVTLHRTMNVGEEELLQQTCDYVGSDDARGTVSASARTFEIDVATIGLAYSCRQIIRSRFGVDPIELETTMEKLRLRESSRKMSPGVNFVLAIPLLEPEDNYTLKSPVIGVVYIDSTAENFYIDDEELKIITAMAQAFLSDLERREPFDRVRNQMLSTSSVRLKRGSLPEYAKHTIDIATALAPPQTSGPFQLNFDYTDFSSN